MKTLLLDILNNIVKHPDEIKIVESNEEKNVIFEIYANSEDVGQIIGKDGRTIKSINILLNAAKKDPDKKFILKVIRWVNWTVYPIFWTTKSPWQKSLIAMEYMER